MKSGEQGDNFLLIFGLFFLCGGLGFGFIIGKMALASHRIHTEYLPATCTIVSKRVVARRDSDGSSYRPEFTFRFRVPLGKEDGRGPEIEVTGYDGVNVFSNGSLDTENIVARYNIGSQYTCLYDPKNPSKAVLVKPTRSLLWLLFPLPFVGIGLFAVNHSIRQWLRGPRFEGPKAPTGT